MQIHPGGWLISAAGTGTTPPRYDFLIPSRNCTCWTPWQRVDVFNGFCQAERAGMLAKGESLQIIRLLEQEVRLGYWPHVEFDWTDAVRTACELRAEHSLKRIVRAMDLFHVAIAIEVGAESLLSFDLDQIALARLAGLKVINLARKARLHRAD